MMKLLKKGLPIALVIVMLAAFAVPAIAQETTTVQVDGLLVYEQPDPNSRLLAVLSLGVSVTRFPDQVQNGFTKVQLPDGTQGWANFSVAGAPGGTSGVGSTGSGPISGVTVQAVGNVRIRDAATLQGARIGLIGWGETASLLAFDETGKWIQINYNGLVGWTASDWFVITGGNAASVAGAAPQAVSALAPSSPVVTNETVNSSATVAGGTQIQAVGNVIIRDAPTLQGNRLALAAWGTVLPLLSIDASGEWGQVDAGGGIVGWTSLVWWRVVSGTVTTTTTLTAVPVTTTVDGQGGGGVQVTSPTGVIVMSLGNVRLRSPETGERLLNVPWGALLPVLGINAEGTQLFVNYNGVDGWVAAEWFEVTSGSLSSVPVR